MRARRRTAGLLLLAALFALPPAAARADESADVPVWGEVVVVCPVDLGELGWAGDLGLRGRPVEEARLERAIRSLLELLSGAGYPFAEVRPGDFDRAGGRVTAILRVDPGTPARIEGIVLEGADVTRTRTVERLTGVHPGLRYTGSEGERIRERLRRSQLFTAVDEVQVLPGVEAGDVVLRVPVTEPAYTRFSGLVGVGRTGEVTGLVDLQLRNLGGTAREGDLAWQNQGEGLTRFHLRYREPWLPVIPVGLSGELRHDINSGVYSFTNWEVAGDLAVGGRWEFRLGVGGAGSVETAPGGENGSETWVLAGGAYDSRNSSWNPSAGARVELESRAGTKTIRPAAGEGAEVRFDRTRWRAAAEGYRALGGRWLATGRTAFQFLDSPEDSLPRFDLIPVGGALSLRGYREEQFLTPLAWTTQTEWRLVQDAAGSAVYGFLDAGLVASGTGRSPDLDTFLLGYGVGVRQATRLGVLGVEYGIPRGTSVLEGRVHLRVASAF